MRLLLDENLPKRLKSDFPNHHVFTVADKQWTGKKNGELLKLMLEDDFGALLTFDKNLQHQQNFQKFPIAVFVLSSPNNTYELLSKFSARINALLESSSVKAGVTIISE
jgi:predicted nuclease of predicted toxin-antitoxin system